MKIMLRFKLPLFAAFFFLIALTTPGYAVDVSCQQSMDDCPLRPDSCGCSSATALSFASYSSKIATAFGGRAPYQFSSPPGFNFYLSDSQTVHVYSSPACSTSTILTVTDTCNNTATVNVSMDSVSPEITGLNVISLGNQYSVSDGLGSDIEWSFTKGEIDSTGRITKIYGCGAEISPCTGIILAKGCDRSALFSGSVVGGWKQKSYYYTKPPPSSGSTTCAAAGGATAEATGTAIFSQGKMYVTKYVSMPQGLAASACANYFNQMNGDYINYPSGSKGAAQLCGLTLPSDLGKIGTSGVCNVYGGLRVTAYSQVVYGWE